MCRPGAQKQMWPTGISASTQVGIPPGLDWEGTCSRERAQGRPLGCSRAPPRRRKTRNVQYPEAREGRECGEQGVSQGQVLLRPMASGHQDAAEVIPREW